VKLLNADHKSTLNCFQGRGDEHVFCKEVLYKIIGSYLYLFYTRKHENMLVLNTVVNKLVFLPCALGFNCPILDVIISGFLRRIYLGSTLKYVTTASSEVLLMLQFNNLLTRHAKAVLNFGSVFKKMRKIYAYGFEIPPITHIYIYIYIYIFVTECLRIPFSSNTALRHLITYSRHFETTYWSRNIWTQSPKDAASLSKRT
jgi:hypothetical protein